MDAILSDFTRRVDMRVSKMHSSDGVTAYCRILQYMSAGLRGGVWIGIECYRDIRIRELN